MGVQLNNPKQLFISRSPRDIIWQTSDWSDTVTTAACPVSEGDRGEARERMMSDWLEVSSWLRARATLKGMGGEGWRGSRESRGEVRK